MNKLNDEAGALELSKTSRLHPQQAAPDFLLRKGDVPGHDFHGNQYTDGGGGQEAARVRENSKNIDNQYSVADIKARIDLTENNIRSAKYEKDKVVFREKTRLFRRSTEN